MKNYKNKGRKEGEKDLLKEGKNKKQKKEKKCLRIRNE